MRLAKQVPAPVHKPVAVHQDLVANVSQLADPAETAHRVKHVPVHHHQLPASNHLVDVLVADVDVAEILQMEAVDEVPQELVVVSSDIDDLATSSGKTQQLADDLVAVVVPEPVSLELPTVNEIPNNADLLWNP